MEAVALLAGIALALALGNPFVRHTRRAAQRLLALSVVGLGAGMNLGAVAAAGAQGVLYTIGGIAICLTLGTLLARRLRVPRLTGALITIGTAICGGSAIAAVVPVLRPKEHETSVALATVFLLNAVALVAFPFIGHRVGLSDAQFGLWSALAIHDTSSVVGASVAWGGKAVEIATTVKLARALWIVPLTTGLALWQKRSQKEVRRPWFILGFLSAAALVTLVPSLAPVGQMVAAVARKALVATLFLIGANLTRESLARVGLRPLAMGVLLWMAMAALSLGAITLHLIS
jgi:uncharacterized integral membrane protein (TIGR00698 family)